MATKEGDQKMKCRICGTNHWLLYYAYPCLCKHEVKFPTCKKCHNKLKKEMSENAYKRTKEEK